MEINEEKSLRNEIDTLNKNIERKDEVIVGLYSVILETGRVALIRKAGLVMLKANLEN